MLRLLLWILSLAWPVIEVVGVMRWLGRLYSGWGEGGFRTATPPWVQDGGIG
jgi:hypothetical protein